MHWIDYSTKEIITDINQFHPDVIGFVYLIEYSDGTKYIGKKNLFSIITMKPLKNGKVRDNTIKQTFSISSGKRIHKDLVKKESNWKSYKGSHDLCKEKIPINKYILDYANSKLELTYFEAKHLFCSEVLESTIYLNDNILGAFYKGHLYGKEIEST